jgi:hypothetical protein
LLGAILSGVATSESGAASLNIATHLLTGVLIPGVKAIMLSPDNENRKRSNLVNQGLQNFVPIPPFGSASTLVFLPRKNLLAVVDRDKPLTENDTRPKFLENCTGDAPSSEETKNLIGHPPGVDWPIVCDKKPFGGAKSEVEIIEPNSTHQLVPVIIKKVLEVQWDPEVISEVNAETVVKGVLKLGMTKEQVRQALGEPDTVTSATDKTSCFLYQEGHSAKSVLIPQGFPIHGYRGRMQSKLLQLRPLTIRTILLGEGFSIPIEKRELVDGSFVWFNAPQVQANLRFDSKGNLSDPDYKEKFDQLNVRKGKGKKEFDQAIEAASLNDDTKKMIKQAAQDKKNPAMYPSPDLKDEHLTVTFKPPSSLKKGPAPKTVGDDWIVDKIERSLRK